jgi:hypothetical protein
LNSGQTKSSRTLAAKDSTPLPCGDVLGFGDRHLFGFWRYRIDPAHFPGLPPASSASRRALFAAFTKSLKNSVF